MRIIIVLASIIAVLAVLLLFPVTVTAQLGEKPTATVKYLFLKINFPKKKKSEKAKNKTAKKAAAAEKRPTPKKEKGGHMTAEQLADYAGILKELLKSLGKLLKLIKLDKLCVNIAVGAENAALCAVEYGAVCAVVYPFCAAVEGALRVNDMKIDINADYDKSFLDGRLYVKASLTPLLGIVAAFGLVVAVLKLMNDKNTKK